MLKTNTFRPDRYLRSKFLEGRYLLATELVDVELELLDQFRKSIKTSIGNVAISSGWEVSYYSNTEVLIKPGSAWYEGLPFDLRSATDQMVVPGILPTGINPTDIVSIPNVGIVVDFNGAPTANYTIVISAEENIVTDIQDPFLKNANIPEATAQKIKLKYKINVVPTDSQGSFSSYRNETIWQNLTNSISVINPSAGEGKWLSTGSSSIPENIDGSNLEIIFQNTQNAGSPPTGGGPLPSTQADRAPFVNGRLIDTTGQSYYITAIFNDPTDANKTIVRVDKDIDQPNPTFTVGSTYKLVKRDVYVTDSAGSGSPVGKLYWPISTVAWNNAGGLFQHSSKIQDIRGRIITEVDYETVVNEKLNLQFTGGGVIDVDVDGETLNWSDEFKIVNPASSTYTIPAAFAVIPENGTLVYFLDKTPLSPLAITINAVSGDEVTLDSVDLSTVSLGNIIKVGENSASIISIDNTNKILVLSNSTLTTGAGYIYRQSFAEGTVKLTEKTYTIATKTNGKIRVGNHLELTAGQSNAIYDVRLPLIPTAIPAATDIYLPVNSITGKIQYYSIQKRNLKVYVNQLLKFQGVDWVALGPDFVGSKIRFNYEIPPYSEIRFRIDSLPAGSLGGGGAGGGASTLQDAYNGSNTILTTPGLPFSVSGLGKVAEFLGSITVTGVIDPAGLELTPQASNPLEPAQKGIWVNTTNQLVYENGTTTENISQRLDDLEDGTSNPITAGAGLSKVLNDISVNVDDSTIEIDTDSLRVKDLGITTAKLDDASVDEDKINSSIAGDGLSGGSGSPLAVNVDATTIEIDTDSLRVKALGIDTPQLADQSVDEDKLNASVAGDGLTGGAGSALAVGAGNGIQVNADSIEVVHAPSTKVTVTVGESVAANVLTLVRWAVTGETEGRVYKANALNASTGKYIVIGALAPTTSLSGGDATTLVMSGELTLGSSDTPFDSLDVGKDLFLKTDGSGSFTLTPSATKGDAQFKIGTVKSTTSIWLGDAYLKAVVPDTLYDQEIYYAAGLAANVPITLPLGRTYNQSSHELQLFVNGILRFQGTDWTATSNTQVQFPVELPTNSRVVFRIIPPASGTLTGGGGGGGGSLQDAYAMNPTITTNSSVPVTINGPVGEKLLVINGSIEVTGVVDPTAIQLTPQSSNPLAPGDKGIWANTSGELVYENGTTTTNISQVITGVENGTSVSVITKSYMNDTGVSIPAYSVVYTSTPGKIELADGGNVNKFRVIGITTEAIEDGESGLVAISGILTGVTGLTHNSYAYLSNTPGVIVDTPPNSPPGFNVVRLGVVDSTSIILQIEHVGTLI